MTGELIFQVSQLLLSTYTIRDSAQREQTENQLKALSQDTENYFEALLAIASSPETAFDSNIRNSAAINLRKFLKEKLEEGTVTDSNKPVLVLKILNAMKITGMEPPVRAALGYALAPVFTLSEGESDTNLIFTVLPALVQALSEGQSGVISACKLLKAEFSVFSTDDTVFSYFTHIKGPLIATGLSVLNELKSCENMQVALGLVECLYELCSALNSVIEHFELAEKQYLKHFIEFHDLSELFSCVLSTNLNDPVLCEASFFCVSPDLLHSRFNQSKSQVVEGLNLLFDYLLDHKKQMAEEAGGSRILTGAGLGLPDCPLVSILFPLIEPIVLSLSQLTRLPNCAEIIQSEDVCELVVDVANLLQKVVRENKFQPFFQENFKMIIVEVCFVLLRAGKREIEDMQDSPEEFVNATLELCERQEAQNLKCTVGMLLEAVCDHIDGAVAFTAQFCVEALEMALTQGSPASFPLLAHFAESPVVVAPPQIVAETAFISLSVISYSVQKRGDLLLLLEDFLRSRWELLRQLSAELVQQRFCLFLHYYIESLFRSDQQWVIQVVGAVVQFCDPKCYKKAVTVQAAITANYLVTDEAIAEKLSEILPGVFSSLVSLIPVQDSVQFFEALQEMVTSHFSVAAQHLRQLIRALVSKIQNLTASTLGSESQRSKKAIFIMKCWSIIRHILSSKSLSSAALPELEELLLPVFEYIRNPQEIDFDDEILLCEVSLTRKCQMVTSVGWTLFSQLPAVQDKYEGTFLQIYPILNVFLYYGRDTFAAHPALIEQVCQMSAKCLFAVYRGKKNEAAHGEGALIYQLILQSFMPLLSEQLKAAVYSYTVLRLRESIVHNFLRARLVGVILCGFAYDPLNTVRILASNSTGGESYLATVFSCILGTPGLFAYPYDRKLATLGLMTLFLQSPLPSELQPFSHAAFQVVVELLGKVQEKPSNGLEKLQKHMKLIDSGDQAAFVAAAGRLSLSSQLNAEEIEAELALSSFHHLLTEQDEYSFFKSSLRQLNVGNPSLMRSLTGALNQVQFGYLSNAIRSKHVEISGFNASVTEVRVISHPKRKTVNSV